MIRVFDFPDVIYLLEATRWTLLLALVATIGGGLLGLVVAIARVLPFKPLNWLAIAYINLIQGTPLLGQLFVFFFALPLVGLSVDAWTAAALSLSIYASAFFGEIWRGGLQSVHQRQWEAGAALARALTDDAFVDAAARSNDASLDARFSMAAVDPAIIEMYETARSLKRRRLFSFWR